MHVKMTRIESVVTVPKDLLYYLYNYRQDAGNYVDKHCTIT
jgi:hypothetical protein